MALFRSSNPSAADTLAFMDEEERRYWATGNGTPEERVQFWESLEALWRSIPDPTEEQLRQVMRDEDWRVCQELPRNREDIFNLYRRKWKADRKPAATTEPEPSTPEPPPAPNAYDVLDAVRNSEFARFWTPRPEQQEKPPVNSATPVAEDTRAADEHKSGYQLLSHEVDRAGKVMGQATELLRRKNPTPPSDEPPNRNPIKDKVIGLVEAFAGVGVAMGGSTIERVGLSLVVVALGWLLIRQQFGS